jgi:hypothetical protein
MEFAHMNKLNEAGTIVSWTPGDSIAYTDLLLALDKAQIDRAFAKEMAPRNAFARACKEMSENRVIDLVEDNNGVLLFQFTAKYLEKSSKQITFEKECTLSLDKTTGNVSCANLELATLANKLIREHMNKRCSADITRLIQKIFEANKGDLVPIRKQGGCYFVPFTHTDLLDQIATLLKEVGGELDRWLIQKTTDSGTNTSIAKSMSDHLLTLINDWKRVASELKETSSTETRQRRLIEWRDLRNKLKSYDGLLGGFSAKLKSELKDCAELVTNGLQEAA